MSEKDDIRIVNRELNKNENKNKKEKTTHIITKSIKRQVLFLIIILVIIIIITALMNAIGVTTVNKVSNISKAISATGKVKDADFIKTNEEEGYYEIDIDKAYEELEEWAKKNSINLRNLGLTKEIYGEMLKMEAEQTLVSLGGTPVGDNAIQGKIVLYRKKSDGTIIPMNYIKKSE